VEVWRKRCQYQLHVSNKEKKQPILARGGHGERNWELKFGSLIGVHDMVCVFLALALICVLEDRLQWPGDDLLSTLHYSQKKE